MKLFFVLFAMLLLLQSIHAQRIGIEELDELILGGIHASGQQRYRRASSLFDAAMKQYPNHPAGYLYKAILLQVMSLDFETPVPRNTYLELLARTRQLADVLTSKPETEAEALYYQGMARSYLAYYHFRDGANWLSGLSHGMSASSLLEKCLEMDKHAYDAMTGIGTYKYWKSHNMKFLTWTPFVDDERALGIELLRRAEAKGRYTAAQATNSLIWIYVEEERWDDAIRCASLVLRRYPKNRLFLWGLASAAEGKEDWKLARQAYQRIVSSLDDEVAESAYIEIQARAKLALMSAHLHDTAVARREGAWVMSRRNIDRTKFTPDGVERINRRIGEVETMLRELKR